MYLMHVSAISEGSWWPTLPKTNWSMFSSKFSQSGQEQAVFKHLLEKNIYRYVLFTFSDK